MPETVQMFVDGSDAVLPKGTMPRVVGKVVLQHTSIVIERHHLAGLFFERHASQEVFHSGINGCGRVFVDILHAILVEINPSFVINFLPRGMIGVGDVDFRDCLCLTL